MATISEVTGDLFDPEFGFDAIGHGVNTQGLMGAGIAKVFRNKYPDMYREYGDWCSHGTLRPGGLMPWKADGLWIYNIASQKYIGASAKIELLHSGLVQTLIHAIDNDVRHLGLPRIGAGIGGLTYSAVYDTVCEVFTGQKLDVTVVTL